MADSPARHVTAPVDQAVADALATISLPPPINLHRYADALAARRGRPIRLLGQHHAGTRPSAVVISTATEDTIVYDTATTPLHARHTVAHELAHLALGHDQPPNNPAPDHPAPGTPAPGTLAPAGGNGTPSTTTGLPADLLRHLTPHLSPELVRRFLGRTVYHDHDEHQAETWATLLMVDTATAPTGPADPTTPLTPTAPRRAFGLRAYHTSTAQRLHTALEPLWHLLPTAVATDLTLTLAASPVLALYRRIIELRDALLLLRPHTHPQIRDWIHHHARSALASTGRSDRLVDAAETLTAIETYQAAQHPHPTPAAAPAVTPPPDLHHEARALLHLLNDLHHPLVITLARRARLNTR